MERDPASARDLRLAAVGCLAVGQAVVFAQVFIGAEAVLVLIAGSALAVGIAALLVRRSLVVATLAAVAGFALALGPLVFRSTTTWFLPTPRTMVALQEALLGVGDQARSQIAPTSPTEALMMATLAAVWAAAFAAHALLIRARAPFLALLPGITLAIFTEVVLGPGVRTVRISVFLGCALFVLFADALSQARRWGRPMAPVRPPLQLTGTSGGRRLGAMVIGVAIVGVATFPPGTGIDPPGSPGSVSSVDPFVSLGAELRSDNPTPLFDITAAQGAYWRTMTLDAFDGRSWSRSLLHQDDGQIVIAGQPLPTPDRDPQIEVLRLEQAVTILGWRGNGAPASADVVQADGGSTALRFDPVSGMLWADGGMEAAGELRITSEIPLPSPEQLDALGDLSRDAAGYDPDWYTRYTELPTTFPKKVRTLAEQITVDEPNAYRKLVALQSYLRSESFTYDESAETPDGADPLLSFLFETRRGFCQQFSGTFAAMARSLGYPSRIAIGFQQGVEDARAEGQDPSFAVNSADAHAWPEVFFPSVGWVAFEPTPSRSNPLAETYANPPNLRPAEGTEGSRIDQGQGGRDPASRPHRERHSPVESTDLDGTVADPTGGSRNPLAIAAILALIAIAWGPVRQLLARARRWRHRPADPVLAAWDDFESNAEWLGFGRTGGETVLRYAERVGERIPAVAPLAIATTRAAYGSVRPDGAAAEEARRVAISAIEELRAEIPLRRRVAGWYRTPSASASSRGPNRPLSQRRGAP